MLLPFTEDFCFNNRRLTFSTINLPLRRCQRGREENFLFLLIQILLVDMHLYPAVRRCPDAKTDFIGKYLFNVAQAVHSLSGQKKRFLLQLHLTRVFRKRSTLSFGTQAARSVNLTEGYPCVLSRTISLQTIRLYSTSQCEQYRYEFTYELTRITKVSTQWYICLLYTSPSPRDGLLSRMPSSA